MRVLHLADIHEYLQGPRAEECRRVTGWISAHAQDTKPDAIIIAGDVFERRSTPQERLFLAEFLHALADVAQVFVIAGNHDDPDDLRLFRAEYGWRTRAEIILEPKVIAYASATLAFLPWPQLGYLAKAGATESIATRREAARGALIDVLRGFRVEPGMAPHSSQSMLVAHVPVTGASMDSGQPVSGGEEIALTVDELLESGAAGVALGHIHLRQQLTGPANRPVWYAGAPFRGSFGEARGTKGGLIWDWDVANLRWQVTPWEVPARSMVLIERTWIPVQDGAVLQPDPGPLAAAEDVADADVRVRITFPVEHREAMRGAMAPAIDALRTVAHAVTVEERPTIISRTRCVEIASARTTIEKLRTWADSVGADVPEGAESKLGILEAGVVS